MVLGFHKLSVNHGFSNSRHGDMDGCGPPSMRHPCRVTAKLPSMAICLGVGRSVRKIALSGVEE